MAPVPTIRQRRLAAELKRLREASGLTLEQVADQIGISRSSLSRVENALVGAKLPVVKALLQLYGVQQGQMDALIQLTRKASRRGWRGYGEDVISPVASAYLSFEAEAKKLRQYEALVIPGLLQTPEYARAVLRSLRRGFSEENIKRRVELRLGRYHLLYDLEIWAVLEESVLHRPIGGSAVLHEQIRHLLSLADRPNIVIQVMPTATGGHGGIIGSFTLLDFSDSLDPPIAFVECALGCLLQDGRDETQKLGSAFEYLCAAALSPEASQTVMRSAIEGSAAGTPAE